MYVDMYIYNDIVAIGRFILHRIFWSWRRVATHPDHPRSDIVPAKRIQNKLERSTMLFIGKLYHNYGKSQFSIGKLTKYLPTEPFSHRYFEQITR